MTGFEPIIAAATTGVSSIVTDIIRKEGTNAFSRLLNIVWGKITERSITKASKKYIINYTKRHGTLKVLGMREPIHLDDVYTSVVLLNESGTRSFSSIEDLEKAYRENPRKPWSSKSIEKRTGIRAANETQFLMVLGAPGSGKTTFLRKIGLEALKVKRGKYEHRCLPVFLELKRFTEDQIDIQKRIIDEFKACRFPDPERLIQEALKKGKLLILLDGLDEVPNVKRDSVIDIIQDFVDKHDNNRFITSCRVAAYKSTFRRYTDVCISEFGDGQIQKYINNWFRSKEDQESGTSKRYWDLLQKPENRAAKELAHTPLLLTFLCLVYDRSQNILNQRSPLYKKALRILLEEWAAEKRILRDEIYQGLSVELEELLLSEIAYERFKEDRLFILENDIVDKIKSFLVSNLNAPKHLSGEKVLCEIAVQQGILVERAEDIYSFSHLTLQEYLTAKYIIDHDQTNTLIEQYLIDRRWREVFLLISGLIPVGADSLLIAMSKFAQQMVQSPKIKALVEWIDRIVIQQKSDNDSLILRVDMVLLALILALTRNRVSDLAVDLDRDFARDSTSDLTLALVLASTSINASDLARDIANDLALTLARADNLNRDRDSNSDSILVNALDRACNRASGLNHARTHNRASIGNSDSVYTAGLARSRARARDSASDLANALTRAQATARDLKSQEERIFSGVKFSTLSETLEVLSAQQPRIKEPVEKHQEFTNQLLNLQYETFQLSESILDFGQKDAEVLESYLYVITLIVQCKKEAIRVSPETWKTVANRMLVPC